MNYTPYDTARSTITQKWRDALAFIEIGSVSDAERLQRDIAVMKFPDLDVRGRFQILRYVDLAVAGIGNAIAGVKQCAQ